MSYTQLTDDRVYDIDPHYGAGKRKSRSCKDCINCPTRKEEVYQQIVCKLYPQTGCEDFKGFKHKRRLSTLVGGQK